jgi:plasmid stabilization system protein ParE
MIDRIVIEPTAERGIREAVRWYRARATPAAAARWLDGLIARIGTLKTDAARCPLADEDDAFEEEIRVLLHGRRGGAYRVLFTIKGDAAHVLYVRHAARDLLRPDGEGDSGEGSAG